MLSQSLKKQFKKSLTLIIGFSLSVPVGALGQSGGGFSNDKFSPKRYNEFFYSPKGTEILVPVKLLGNVKQPGLYHIPVNTPLTTLLSISGGFNDHADLEKVVVNRKSKEPLVTDLTKMMKEGRDVALTSNDIVFIPEDELWFSANTVNTIGVITGVLGIIISGYVLREASKK